MQVLMTARLTEEPTEEVLQLVEAEAQAVWQLYEIEQVRSFYYLADMSGVVLMLEVQNLEEAKTIIKSLPMVKANLLNVELLPLKPYTGLESLFKSL